MHGICGLENNHTKKRKERRRRKDLTFIMKKKNIKLNEREEDVAIKHNSTYI